ncbi:hypothetical protein J7E50_19730 [Pedobacter sp. ISL-68]|uniref:hypothetical protein n=1 Tax=unclassified Pedobacter TaxID=2628915 RepID=UPI001BE74856|nr:MULTISPECIES: hypothetical protein [unclassified Pedobacter]MBT2564417.1 hypothetical protein [Pedobacter sp. ISL-64]MBT2592457.1 hypothetical protein [Pedobacter sp. ISL-68]
MAEIDTMLNPMFLLNLVAIETIKHYSTIDTSIKDEGLESKVELKVMLLKPTEKENEVNEHFYELILTHVTNYQIDFINEDNRTFEFDTDEVQLERDDKSDVYILSFINSSISIYIKFSELEMKLLNCNEPK